MGSQVPWRAFDRENSFVRFQSMHEQSMSRVKLWIDNSGLDGDAVDSLGRAAQSSAALVNNHELCSGPMDAGAWVHMQAWEGESPADHARRIKSIALVALFDGDTTDVKASKWAERVDPRKD